MKIFVSLFIALVLSACFKSGGEANSETSNKQGAQSAIEVKSQTQQLNLKSLSDRSHAVNQPQLRTVAEAYATKAQKIQVEDTGYVVKLLPDDNDGLRHQKFLVKVASGQTLLFAHNVDLAARVADLHVGDEVDFRGEYVYNPKGGIVHWTHHDPQGRHYAGWIKHNGQTYD